MDAVKAALQAAESSWPAELKERGGYVPDAPKGILWFETAEELLELRDEAGGAVK